MRLILVLGAILSININIFAVEIAKNFTRNSEKYLSFEDAVFPDKRNPPKIWRDKEIKRWENSIRKAVDNLPEEFLEKIGPVRWRFYINQKDWATAFAGSNDVYINLLSNYIDVPEWMTWEPFRKDGLNSAEMEWVALHEMAHIYNPWGDDFAFLRGENKEEYTAWSEWSWNKSTKRFVLLSGIDFISIPVLKEKETTLYGKQSPGENFADTLALYVMWPEYLKSNFPLQYGAIKEILVREYESRYPMPSSIETRLTVRSGKNVS